MKNIYKIFAVVLSLILFSCSALSLQSFALEDEFEGQQYLSEQCIALLEGDYDSDESYTYDLMEIAKMTDNEGNSGSLDGTKFASEDGTQPTHQRICAEALAILAHDKGNSVYNSAYNVTVVVDADEGTTENRSGNYNNLLIEYSAMPDRDEIGLAFAAHFYNPYTEKGYLGTGDTAKDKATEHYNNAVSLYNEGVSTNDPEKVYEAMQQLGRGLHFVQDSCETHHCNNKIAKLSKHDVFETAIDQYLGQYSNVYDVSRMQTYLNNVTPFSARRAQNEDVFDSSVYSEVNKVSMVNLMRDNSYSSYTLYEKTLTNNTDYNDVIVATYKNAVTSSVQYLYKFATTVGITFS